MGADASSAISATIPPAPQEFQSFLHDMLALDQMFLHRNSIMDIFYFRSYVEIWVQLYHKLLWYYFVVGISKWRDDEERRDDVRM